MMEIIQASRPVMERAFSVDMVTGKTLIEETIKSCKPYLGDEGLLTDEQVRDRAEKIQAAANSGIPRELIDTAKLNLYYEKTASDIRTSFQTEAWKLWNLEQLATERRAVFRGRG